MTFSDLGLAAPLLKALEGEGYSTPTPIQAQAIPAVLAGSDLLGIAQTGTGKTAAFALPILHRLGADRRSPMRKSCHVLVLSPTRELASQIADSFRTYGRHMNISVAVIFGGVGHRPQVQAMARGVDVLVATPGRLLDHLGEGSVTLSGTSIFVLDEADQMLDLGFVKPIRQIVKHLGMKRQNLFFSATMPKEIAGLADDLLRDPVKIAVTPVATTADRVSQRVIHIEHVRKRTLLTELFADPGMERTLVFTRTKRGADRVAKHLEGENIPSAAIHGNKSQKQREAALLAFRNAKIRVLVATDIAARGIDIDGVSHVINFELPDVPEAYVHRIGRTARAGAAGSAISLCAPDERDLLRSIERLTRQSIPSEDRRSEEGAAEERMNQDRAPRRGSERRGASSNADRGERRSDAARTERGERRSDSPRAGQGDRRGAAPRTDRSEHRGTSPRGERNDRAASGSRSSGRDGVAQELRRQSGNGRSGGSAETNRPHAPIRFGAPQQRAANGGHSESRGDSASRGEQGGQRQPDGASRGRRRRSRGNGASNPPRSPYQASSTA
jgi:ATP-dependent RNA helicase RhlE